MVKSLAPNVSLETTGDARNLLPGLYDVDA
jgi:hypothetical protein